MESKKNFVLVFFPSGDALSPSSDVHSIMNSFTFSSCHVMYVYMYMYKHIHVCTLFEIAYLKSQSRFRRESIQKRKDERY